MDNGCNYFEILISRSLDDRLSKDEERLLNKHLLTCKSCKAFLDNALILNKLLDKDLSLKPIPLPRLKQRPKVKLPIWIKITACFLIIVLGSISGIKWVRVWLRCYPLNSSMSILIMIWLLYPHPIIMD